ncbi:MAG: MBL fold metallo-hydrolase [Deltaproteobacteria bacterium]|jgi:glyoxylase-like metal-dependent hydrolase (beta-lactamase superfamily II)|nr:MBL fold metallo-hydrolase [Deltaproteobacteria bacterium]
MSTWNIGEVKVSRIIESEAPWPGTWLLPDATPENIKKEASWLFPTFSDEKGKLRMAIHALVLESQGKRIVVDTCIGNDKVRSNPAWSNLKLPFLDDLKKAGYTRDNIDIVVCTHLHVDHVGWNTTLENGKWVPTFPNARYLVGGTEWDYWSKSDNKDSRDPVEDSVRPVVDSGHAKLVDSDYRITDEVWLEPTPGHTPGHHSVRISSKGHDAVITGDLIHHPVQFQYPEWDDAFDSDLAMAKSTRRAFAEKYADRDVLVFGTHFATPSAGKITRSGSAFRFKAAL